MNLLFNPPARLAPGLLLSLLLTLFAAETSAAPVHRHLTPAPLPLKTAEWDLDEDGVIDLRAEAYMWITNSIPGSTSEGVTLKARSGMDLLTDGAPFPELSLLAPGAAAGPDSPGSWWQGGPSGHMSLGGSQSSVGGQTFQGPFAYQPTGWIGFRLRRGGQTYYGALQGGPTTLRAPALTAGTFIPLSEGPALTLGVASRPADELPPHNLHAVILESEPDTPVTPPLPFLSLHDGGRPLPDGANLDFGVAGVGEYSARTVRVTSNIAETLTDLVWTIEGPHAADFVIHHPPPQTVGPDDTPFVSIGFSPGLGGNRTAALRISRGAADPHPFRLTFSAEGNAAAAQLQIEEPGIEGLSRPISTAQPYDLGTQEIGGVTRKVLRVRNIGGKTFEGYATMDPYGLRGIALLLPYETPQVIQATPPGFSLRGGQNLRIPPGHSADLEFAWRPNSLAREVATVRIYNSNTGSGLTFAVTGTATRATTGSGPYTGPVEQHVTFRLGDGQNASVVSGAPVEAEGGLIMGSQNAWDGLYGSRGILYGYGNQTIFLNYGFQAILRTGNAPAPTLLPLTGPQPGVPELRSRAALHFTPGDMLLQTDLGVPQCEEVGMQLWVRAGGATGTHPVSQFGDPEGDGFGIWQVEGEWRGRMANGAWVGQAPVQPGLWQHLALVRHGGASTLYINGVAAGASSAAPIRTPPVSTGVRPRPAGLQLGGALAAGGSSFAGDLDELQLFTLVPGADFTPASHLSPGALPRVKVIAPQQTLASMVGRSLLIYVDITNVGDGYATVTAQGVFGEAAEDYVIRDATPVSWADGPPGSERGVRVPFHLGPGETRQLEVVFAPKAAGSRTASLQLQTNDPASPLISVPFHGVGSAAAARLAVLGISPQGDELAFGPVLTGGTRLIQLAFKNAGALPLTGIQWEILGPEPARFSVHETPFTTLLYVPPFNGTLAAGQQVYMTATFSPGTADRLHQAVLRIRSSDPQVPVRDILLTGRGMQPAPEIEVLELPTGTTLGRTTLSGSTIGFATTMVGDVSQPSRLQITNYGPAPLRIQSIGLGGPNGGDFELNPVMPQGTVLTLEPGATATLTVTFKPQTEGWRTASLDIVSDDPDESHYQIVLAGSSVASASDILVVHNGNHLPPNQCFVNLGESQPGVTGAETTVTVKNAGTQTLTGLALSVTGADAGAIEFGPLSSTSLGFQDEATFTLRMRPADVGPLGATLLLTSNDPDEAVTQIHVGGTGAYGARSLLRAEVSGWTGTALAETPEGTVLLAGYTTETGTGARTHEVRLIARDGAEAEVGSARPDGLIKAVAATPDGGILIAGEFAHVDGAARQGVARLNADGSLDISFAPPEGDFKGLAVVPAAGGKVLVGGTGGLGGRNHLVRLKEDGQLDAGWSLPAPNAPVTHLVLQEDGRVLVGGRYTNYDIFTGPNTAASLWDFLMGPGCVRRLGADGALDNNFGLSGAVHALEVRGGRIWTVQTQRPSNIGNAGIGWNWWPEPTRDHLRCYSMDGNLVNSVVLDEWNAHSSQVRRTLAVQRDGAVLVAPGPRFWGSSEGGLQQVSRYKPDGSVDPTFYSVLGRPAQVEALHVQADGRVLIAGEFTGVNEWNSIFTIGPPPSPPTTGQPGHGDGGPASGFVQVMPDGDCRPDLRATDLRTGRALSDGLSTLSFHSQAGEEVGIPVQIESYLMLRDYHAAEPVHRLAPVIEGAHAGDFRVEVVETPAEPQAYWRWLKIAVRFRAGGPGLREATLKLSLKQTAGSSYDFNTLDLRLQGLDGSGPELQVAEPAGGRRIHKGHVADFGNIALETSRTLTFDLRNAATQAGQNLQTITAQLVGPQASSFQIVQAPASTLKPGAATTLGIRCTPLATGPLAATVEIRSNDPLTPVFRWRVVAEAVAPGGLDSQSRTKIARVGESVSFSAVSGEVSAAHAWQWLKNGRVIRNAGGSTYSIPSVVMADAGSYTVKPAATGAKVTGHVGRLAVYDYSPGPALFVPGKALTLTFQASGTELTYLWLKDGASLANDRRFTGALTRTLTLAKTTAADAGQYECLIGAGKVRLDPATSPRHVSIQARTMVAPEVTTLQSAWFFWTVGCEAGGQVSAAGDSGRFTVTGLPPGVRMDAVTGRFSGRPTRADVYYPKVKAANAAGTSQVRELTIVVNALAVAGQHAGLLDRREGWFHGRGGKLELTVGNQGAATGKLTLHSTATAPVTYAIAGTLRDPSQDGESAALQVSLKRTGGLPPLALACQFGPRGFTFTLDGEPAGKGGKKTGQALFPRFYNLALEAQDGMAGTLGVQGYARANLTAAGSMVWAGRLGSAGGVRTLAFSSEVVAVDDSLWHPVYAATKPGETLTAWLEQQDGSRWFTCTNAGWTAPAYRDVWAGGNVALTILGNDWRAPAAPDLVLGMLPVPGNARITIGARSQILSINSRLILPAGAGVAAWPAASAGGLLRSAVMTVPSGTFSGTAWSQGSNPNAPGARIEGLFIERLGRGAGIAIHPVTPGAPGPAAEPVTIEPVE